jgi:tetraacyldisaccharide 4'-kinase
MMKNVVKYIESQWYDNFTWFRLLIPFSYLYIAITIIRKKIQLHYSKTNNKLPIWVVGEISVGGSGKSPFVIWLVELMIKNGLNPVVLCSGYKGSLQKNMAGRCLAESDYKIYGDEAVMLAKAVNAPVVVGKKRNLAVEFINNNMKDCNIIICDDGLQHYKMRRNKEIVIYNESRIGNGYCFPAGPLREPKSRLRNVDLILRNNNDSGDTKLLPKCIASIYTGETKNFTDFPKKVHAVAGIGSPKKFFALLRSLNFEIIEHAFPDHYAFREQDLSFNDDLPIILTTKDAVKCTNFNIPNIWQVLFEVEVSAKVTTKILQML